MSCSFDWIFKGYRKVFVGLIRKYGFRRGLVAWDNVLFTGVEKLGFDLIIAPVSRGFVW